MTDPAFEVGVFTLEPGGTTPYREADWRGALVAVERGELELEACDGERHLFTSGAVLHLDGLALRALHNPGEEAVLLVTVARAMSD